MSSADDIRLRLRMLFFGEVKDVRERGQTCKKQDLTPGTPGAAPRQWEFQR
jgi:hypothetical protein